MDRFIAHKVSQTNTSPKYLKSNMDRFIDENGYFLDVPLQHLKSNMDRFIVSFSTLTKMLKKI